MQNSNMGINWNTVSEVKATVYKQHGQSPWPGPICMIQNTLKTVRQPEQQ